MRIIWNNVEEETTRKLQEYQMTRITKPEGKSNPSS